MNESILLKGAVTDSIYHITPFTVLDFPHKTACIIWFAGCNMRCKYCYNPDIVRGKGTISFEDAFKWISSRKGFLDGVVLSGGECLMHKNIESFIRNLKDHDFLIKVDTNGSYPLRLKSMVQNQLINYIALDFKALPNHFYRLTQSNLFNKFQQSLDFLIKNTVKFEVRTTVHSKLIQRQDLIQMIRYLETRNYSGTYYLQNFYNNCQTLGELPNDYDTIKQGDLDSEKFEIVVRS